MSNVLLVEENELAANVKIKAETTKGISYITFQAVEPSVSFKIASLTAIARNDIETAATLTRGTALAFPHYVRLRANKKALACLAVRAIALKQGGICFRAASEKRTAICFYVVKV